MVKNPYSESGVDVAKGDEMVDWLKSNKSTNSPLGETISGIGGFAALFQPNFKGYSQPVLVSATDGIGTKLLLGIEHNKLQGLGQDLVAMCVNDLYTVGARPMFFLDYLATGKLDADQFQDVLSGIQSALSQCETVLIGGETAELPGLYQVSHFDAAGFVVGLVDKPKILSAKNIKPGQQVFGFQSSGFHSNGYSLIRKWLANDKNASQEVIDFLLQPTRIYQFLPELCEKTDQTGLTGLSHITGGGISGNLVRILPPNCKARLDRSKIPTPELMKEFIGQHHSERVFLEEVFNMGVGMMAVVEENLADTFCNQCPKDAKPIHLGEIIAGDKAQVIYD